MPSVNQIILIGNLGRDPEMRYSATGSAKTEFSVATTRSWKKDDEWQEETDWHNIVMWGQRGERAAEVLRKGMQVFVSGRQTNRSYEDKDGVKKYRSEVIADVAYQLGRKEDREETINRMADNINRVADSAGGEFSGAPRAAVSPRRQQDDDLDDLPF